MQLKGKKVLVTGGAGFIGSHTVDALIKEGAKVMVVDNLSTGRKENLNPKAKFYKLNIKSPKIEEIIKKEKPEIVYHFAHFVLVPKSVKNPLLDMDCLIGTIRILKSLTEIKNFKKFVMASSGFLYGNTKHRPTKETEPISPISPYVVTKKAIENYLEFYKQTYGIPRVILRYPGVYGPRQITGAMADYIRKLSTNKQAEIWGDGKKTRDYIFIEDVVRANIVALDLKDNYSNPVFNVGTGIETTLNELYFKIAKKLNKKASPIYYPDRKGEQVRYSLDASKIKKELGWSYKISLEEGLEKTLKYWKLI
ncbi:MAG: GDP-mannose 4,6-dehydratase [Candidatus Paceibacterota bacterium]|jgi:UDP-glucose 4-epimerase